MSTFFGTPKIHRIIPFYQLDNDDVTDDETEEGEKVDEEEKREMVDVVDDNSIYSIENKFKFVVFLDKFRVGLHHHHGCALVELQVGVLKLPEHDGLRQG